jgi:hypothetical protein
MEIFEYLEYKNIKYESLIKIANEKGKEGWELVYVRGGNNYLFKRRLSTNANPQA